MLVQVRFLLGGLAAAFLLFASTAAQAIPAYARQTGAACADCHAGAYGPALTPYGMVGIAPKSRISVYKACWYPDPAKGARCNSFTLAKALAAVNDTDARIVNMRASPGSRAGTRAGRLPHR